MSKSKTQYYEAMYIISQATAVDLSGVVEFLTDMIGRAGGELIAMKKWDERRMSFEIEKQKRGIYLLAYFSAPNDALVKIERECNLSERIMRLMIVRCDQLNEDQMRAADAREELATEAKLRAEKAAEEADTVRGVSVGAPEQEGDSAQAAEASSGEGAVEPEAVVEKAASEAPEGGEAEPETAEQQA